MFALALSLQDNFRTGKGRRYEALHEQVLRRSALQDICHENLLPVFQRRSGQKLSHDTRKRHHSGHHPRELQNERGCRAFAVLLVLPAPFAHVQAGAPWAVFDRDGLRVDDTEEPPRLPLVLPLRTCVHPHMQDVCAGARPVVVQAETMYAREHELGFMVFLPEVHVLMQHTHVEPVGVHL